MVPEQTREPLPHGASPVQPGTGDTATERGSNAETGTSLVLVLLAKVMTYGDRHPPEAYWEEREPPLLGVQF